MPNKATRPPRAASAGLAPEMVREGGAAGGISEYGRGGAAGAQMETEYLGQQQRLTLVNVEDLKDWRSSMREESLQFSIALFFASGSLWLGLERLFTDGPSDGLFQFCGLAFLASGIVAFFGYKQLGRRSHRIERYIEIAERQREAREARQ